MCRFVVRGVLHLVIRGQQQPVVCRFIFRVCCTWLSEANNRYTLLMIVWDMPINLNWAKSLSDWHTAAWVAILNLYLCANTYFCQTNYTLTEMQYIPERVNSKFHPISSTVSEIEQIKMFTKICVIGCWNIKSYTIIIQLNAKSFIKSKKPLTVL